MNDPISSLADISDTAANVPGTKTTFTITDGSDLATAIADIDRGGADALNDTNYLFVFAPTSANTITLTAQLDAINLDPGSALLIDGSGGELNGAGAYAGFFDYQGSVEIADLVIADTLARGGNGGGGGGGGAGLGGGLFVAAQGIVTLLNVNFGDDTARGGNGEAGHHGGGGGLLGGNGGRYNSSGGGGVGAVGGAGGSGGPGGTGLIAGAAAGGAGNAGTGGRGGANGGGGGGNVTSGAGGSSGGGGGGGGVGGMPGSSKSEGGSTGGAGGFGGGGGGGEMIGGHGGFGGGGGGGGGETSGSGGFGGGGGAGSDGYKGGFGGGAGEFNVAGGGGLGAGGDIFVQHGGTLNIGAGILSAGTVTGGSGANSGQAFGSAIFLQGNETITLGPASGQTLIISGSIADQTGSTHQTGNSPDGTPFAGAGGLLLNGAGDVDLAASNTFTGGIALDAGTLELGTQLSAGSGAITFHANTTLRIDSALTALPTNVLTDLQVGDTLDFAGSGGAITSVSLVTGGTAEIAVQAGTTTYRMPVAAVGHLAFSAPANDGHGGQYVVTACYAQGTCIATPAGEVPIERLAVGQCVSLARGGSAPVRWLGRRHVDVATHDTPARVQPLRIRADAFAPGAPHRDLLLSPDHAVFVDGVLIPIHRLENGSTIARARVSAVTYWHVELAAHDIILAEGLAAESWLDTGNRGMFDNLVRPVESPPADAPHIWAQSGCAPLIEHGPILAAIRERLATRALAMGLTAAASLEVAVDAPGHVSITVAPWVARARLVSPNGNAPGDRRMLGALLQSVRVDNVPLPARCYGSGFHAEESHDGRIMRWTDGDAILEWDPAPWIRVLNIEVAGVMM